MRPLNLLALASVPALLAACGGQTTTGSTSVAATPAGNVQPIQVGSGPANNMVDGLLTSVTICVPNTSDCQTISGIQIDTGSVGLRILSSQVSLTLPRISAANGDPLGNCAAFADLSYAWGPMATADVKMANETAASVPIQLLGTPAFPGAPRLCSQGGTAANSLTSLGANGLLGIGVFRQDCGPACSGSPSSAPAIYFSCPNSTCSVTSVPLQNQLQNPVWLFPQDNNGVLIQLPSVPATGTSTLSGSLIFGIGTRANNALGGARVYMTDGNGELTTTFRGSAYPSYLDTGSDGLFFLDDSTTGLPACPGEDSGYYCPPATVAYTATNTGNNGTLAQVSFSIANAETLFQTGHVAFDNLGGPNSGEFDWGLPFFLGRSTFIGIEEQNSPAGAGPFFAY